LREGYQKMEGHASAHDFPLSYRLSTSFRWASPPEAGVGQPIAHWTQLNFGTRVSLTVRPNRPKAGSSVSPIAH